MSFSAGLDRRAEVYAREAGQEHWQRVTRRPLACRVVELPVSETEVALVKLGARVTHRARCLPEEEIQAGRRLVVDGEEEYLIVTVRKVGHPAPQGHLTLSLEAVESRARPPRG